MENSKSRLPRNQHFPFFGVRSSGLLKSPELGTPDLDFSKVRFSNVPKWLAKHMFWGKQSVEILASSTPTEKWLFQKSFLRGGVWARISAHSSLPKAKVFESFWDIWKTDFWKVKIRSSEVRTPESGVPSSGLFRSPELWIVNKKEKKKKRKKLIFKPIYFWNCRNSKILWKVIKIDRFLRIMWGGIQTAQLFCLQDSLFSAL